MDLWSIVALINTYLGVSNFRLNTAHQDDFRQLLAVLKEDTGMHKKILAMIDREIETIIEDEVKRGILSFKGQEQLHILLENRKHLCDKYRMDSEYEGGNSSPMNGNETMSFMGGSSYGS